MAGPSSHSSRLAEAAARKKARKERRMATLGSGGASTSALPPFPTDAAEPEQAEPESGNKFVQLQKFLRVETCFHLDLFCFLQLC